jgi:hypothetical protein
MKRPGTSILTCVVPDPTIRRNILAGRYFGDVQKINKRLADPGLLSYDQTRTKANAWWTVRLDDPFS